MNPYANPPREITLAGRRVLLGALGAGLLINLLIHFGVIAL